MATPDEPNELERALSATMDALAALGADFGAYWPDLEDIPCGNDIIGGPVAGLPDNETLSALVADANLTGDENE